MGLLPRTKLSRLFEYFNLVESLMMEIEVLLLHLFNNHTIEHRYAAVHEELFLYRNCAVGTIISQIIIGQKGGDT